MTAETINLSGMPVISPQRFKLFKKRLKEYGWDLLEYNIAKSEAVSRTHRLKVICRSCSDKSISRSFRLARSDEKLSESDFLNKMELSMVSSLTNAKFNKENDNDGRNDSTSD